MGCHMSTLEQRISDDLNQADILRKDVGAPRLVHHKNATIGGGAGCACQSTALVLTSSQVWVTNAAMPDRTWNIPLDRLVGVDVAKHSTGKKGKSNSKVLMLEFNDMDTGMHDALGIATRNDQEWAVAIRKARDSHRKNMAENAQ